MIDHASIEGESREAVTSSNGRNTSETRIQHTIQRASLKAGGCFVANRETV